MELNAFGLGIDLGHTNISSIFFADDIILIGRSKDALDKLMGITQQFFSNHRLELSESKSKILTHNAETGKTTFHGTASVKPLTLDQVLSFKYLGVPLGSSTLGIFKNFNEHVKKKAQNYLTSVLSLVRSGPNRSDLAFTLWTRCALPSILYGSDVIPLLQGTIAEIERCQTLVGKFILQIPRNSSNISSNIDAGLKPVWAVVAEKFLLYAYSTMRKPGHFWPKMALDENIFFGAKSPYTKTLLKWKHTTNSYGMHPKQIKSSVNSAAIIGILNEQQATNISTFAMNGPGASNTNSWFKPKRWVNDSCFSKIISEFRVCNSSLGNRGPTRDGKFYKLCPLCSTDDNPSINNEVKYSSNNLYTFIQPPRYI